MPGPAPKPAGQARRRNAPTANTVKLPAEGRRKPAPEWPMDGAAPALWHDLWQTPQAVVWERQGWTRVVARYVRVVLDSELRGAPASILAEARQMEDRLGLTPMSMLRLRWEIVADDVAEQRTSKPAAKPTGRKRMRIVDSDDVESA